jgi:N6-L-threonylcarbamoyladenine synthase
MKNKSIIIGIETSCDDTCVAVLKLEKKKAEILSNIVSSQTKIHSQYGGVYPFMAKREHRKNLPLVFKKALQKAGIKEADIDLITVTAGPGLEPCLWTGINFAENLAKKLNLPIRAANHLEGHIMANFIDSKKEFFLPDFRGLLPATCLIASGGHSQLILIKKPNEYETIGETRDDAAGECFDKTARIIGLKYPGGPAIAAEAAKKNNFIQPIKLPRPMLYDKNYDFSFSGLKTAVLYDFKKRSSKIKKSKDYIRAISAEIEQAIIDVLLRKTIKAALNYGAKSIILGGGVIANENLRKQFKEKSNWPILIFPEKKLCGDNAAMTALAALLNPIVFNNKKEIKAKANLKANEKI